MRRILAACMLALALIAAPPASADGPLPEALRSAGVTQVQWDAVQAEVRAAAGRARVSERALAAVAERLGLALSEGGRRVDVGEIFGQLDALATRIAELETRLATLARDEDPGIAALITQAREAISAGDLDAADRALAEARRLRSERNALLRERLESGLLEEAAIVASQGEVAMLRADYLGAAALYAEAAELAPEGARERWQYRVWQGAALYERGLRFETDRLHEAVRVYRELGLPLAPRTSAPADWAATQNNLGAVLIALGERGDDVALREAVAALRVALEVHTRTDAPADWAQTQNNLGNALSVLGERGDDAALREAIVAYRAALEVRTRVATPADWAQTQSNLGSALRMLGQRGDDRALREAIAAFRAALEVRTRAAMPADWAATQNSLGNALGVLGQRGDDVALREAIAAFRAALEVRTRAEAPAHWAGTQNNLGNALAILGARGDDTALNEAIAAYRLALEVRTREAAPADWAETQFNLALAYRTYVLRGDRSHLSAALEAARYALSGYEQVGNAYWGAQARRLVADLEAR